MAIRTFKTVTTASTELDRVQQNIGLFTTPLINNPMLDGMLLEDVVLTTSETNVPHMLNRPYMGWTLVNKNAQADVWVSSSTQDTIFLNLTASAAVTVSLWVF